VAAVNLKQTRRQTRYFGQQLTYGFVSLAILRRSSNLHLGPTARWAGNSISTGTRHRVGGDAHANIERYEIRRYGRPLVRLAHFFGTPLSP